MASSICVHFIICCSNLFLIIWNCSFHFFLFCFSWMFAIWIQVAMKIEDALRELDDPIFQQCAQLYSSDSSIVDIARAVLKRHVSIFSFIFLSFFWMSFACVLCFRGCVQKIVWMFLLLNFFIYVFLFIISVWCGTHCRQLGFLMLWVCSEKSFDQNGFSSLNG